MSRYCDYCGKPFFPRSPLQKFCSYKCQQASYYQRKTKPKRKDKKVEKMTRKREIEFIEQSLLWPKHPILPVVLRDGDFNDPFFAGFLFSFSCDPLPVVYYANVFGLDRARDKAREISGREKVTWGEVLDQLDRRAYASFDSLLDVYRID